MKIRRELRIKGQVLIICGLIAFIIFISFLNVPNNMLNSAKIRLGLALSNQSDYACLIDMNFTFEMLPQVCNNESDGILLTLVHSAPDHFNHRKVIRETWGQWDDDIRFLFLLGAVEDTAVQGKLEEESKQHNDIVQGNFLDTYHNLTYKHVMALKYSVYHCPQAHFLFKVDDDVFVNIPILKMLINSYHCENGNPTKILCSRLLNPPVLRDGKWATSLEEFPDSHYPNHCGGFAILYPRNVIYSLYTQAQKTKFFWVDDVFVSGICAKKANVTHIGIENLVLSHEEVRDIVDLSFTNITKPFLTGSLNLDEKKIRSLWDFVQNHKPKTILEYLKYD